MKLDKQNYTMLCDFYELTMANGYFKKGMQNDIAYFDVFFRAGSRRRQGSPSPPVWNRSSSMSALCGLLRKTFPI